jgi:hypothetical protein
VYSKPAGTTAVPNSTIESSKFNAVVDDLVADANAARPITAGGTGATSAASARTALAVPGTATANTFTATQTWSKGADVASATALTLGDDGNYFDITGTTTVTSIATKGVGTVVNLHFDASLILTHHATDLILPGAANITTAAGDEAEFVEYATGDWRCTNYTFAAGRTPRPTATSSAIGEWRALQAAAGVAAVLPTGGTWAYFMLIVNNASGALNSPIVSVGVAAGGTSILAANGSARYDGFCWRVA